MKNNSVHEVYLLHPQFFSLSRLLTGRRCFEKQFVTSTMRDVASTKQTAYVARNCVVLVDRGRGFVGIIVPSNNCTFTWVISPLCQGLQPAFRRCKRVRPQVMSARTATVCAMANSCRWSASSSTSCTRILRLAFNLLGEPLDTSSHRVVALGRRPCSTSTRSSSTSSHA